MQKDLHDDFMPPGYLVTLLEVARSADKYGLPGLALAAHNQLNQRYHQNIGLADDESFISIDVLQEIDQILLLLHRLWEGEHTVEEMQLRRFMLSMFFEGLRGSGKSSDGKVIKWIFGSSIVDLWRGQEDSGKSRTDKHTHQIKVIQEIFENDPAFARAITKTAFTKIGDLLEDLGISDEKVGKLQMVQAVNIEEIQRLRNEVTDLKTSLGKAQRRENDAKAESQKLRTRCNEFKKSYEKLQSDTKAEKARREASDKQNRRNPLLASRPSVPHWVSSSSSSLPSSPSPPSSPIPPLNPVRLQFARPIRPARHT
jgi:regulator of replication initiation timing